MITLGLVDSVDSNGVYVSMPGSRGVLRGPYLTLQDVAVGDRVLVVVTDDGEAVIVGQAAASASGVVDSAMIANGTIVDADVHAAAEIGRTKIAGIALTRASTGVFSVLDYGAVGDNSHDDTAAIQAAVTAAAVTGGEVFMPPGVYRIDGTLTLPMFTKLRGSRHEFGAGSNLTVLNITTKTADHIGIDALAGSCTIEDLAVRGTYSPYDTTTIGIKARTATFRNVYIAGFYYGMKLYQAYYAVLDRVEFARNSVHLSCEEVYDLNLYGCTFSNEPVYGPAANTALELGTIRSFSMFGGSIEGYKNGISLTSGGCHLFGVYFETGVADAYGIALWDCTGANVIMTGCNIYLDYHTFFVRMSSGATDTSILSNGNVFCSGATAHGNPGNVFYLAGGVEAHLAQDNWYGVQDDTLYYVGGLLNLGPFSGSVIEFPVGYTHAADYSVEASPVFMGKPMYMGDGKNIQLGENTGTKIGSRYYEKLGFLGATPVTRQTVTGSKGGNAALGSLITALAAFGLILDSTS